MSRKTPKEYVSWLNDESNGLIVRKSVNGLLLSVKFLPPDYLAYQELKNQGTISENQMDSLIAYYNHALTFMLSIAPDTNAGLNEGDVMYLGVRNAKEYEERALLMNFDMREYISMRMDDSLEYVPVLTNMENTYGMSTGRNVICVFAPVSNAKEFKQSKQIDFIWDDEVFQSGRNHFVFESNDLFSSPGIKY